FERGGCSATVAATAPEMPALDEGAHMARIGIEQGAMYRRGLVKPVKHTQIARQFELDALMCRRDRGGGREGRQRSGTVAAPPSQVAGFNQRTEIARLGAADGGKNRLGFVEPIEPP